MTLTPHESMVLEASAGTGKTYSIERLVLKALLEAAPGLNRPLSLQEILLVTFTNAAVQELKDRIRALLQSESRASGRTENEKRLLKLALSDFDAAPIYTIHGFCYKVLKEQAFESGVDLHRRIADDSFQDQDVKAVIDQVFREEVTKERFTPQQISLLLKSYGFKTAKLVKDLTKYLSEGDQIVETPGPEECYQHFSAHLGKYRNADLEGLKKIYNKTGEWSQGAIDLLCSGSISKESFDKEAGALLKQVELFSFVHLIKRIKAQPPSLITELMDDLLPPLKGYADVRFLFLRLLKLCQKRLEQEVAVKGPLTFNSSIHLVIELVQKNLRALKQLKERYPLVFIDEFQDTDPDQWKLFHTLFKNDSNRMILVGDPKQAIYRFRGADIYTYMGAVKALGEDSKRKLTTNYRSDPLLVKALNSFFMIPPQWIALPYQKEHLPFQPVEAGAPPPEKGSSSPMAVWVSEGPEELFYPLFVKESIRLKTEEGYGWERIAVLVRDHKQAKAIQETFSRCGIPTFVQREDDQLAAAVQEELLDLIEAIERPHEAAYVKKALCGRIFGWAPDQIAAAEENPRYLEALAFFRNAHQKSFKEGMAAVLCDILYQKRTELLSQEQGVLVFEKALQWIEKLLKTDELSAELESQPKSAGPGVQIITLFVSKGLEYDAVFVPGVYARSPSSKGLETVKTEQGRVLTPLDEEDPLYEPHLEELDAEKARQFYVAMTRAKHRLYLPVILGLKAPSKGRASALELFMAQCEAPEASWKELYAVMGSSSYPRFFEALRKIPEISLDNVAEEPLPQYQNQNEASPLTAPQPACRTFAEIFHYSFSSLAKSHEGVHQRGKVEPDGLPAGKETGILLHGLLEKAPWRLVQSAREARDFLPFVKKQLSKSSFEQHAEPIAEMLYQAFSAPLSPFSFALRDVDEGALVREMEFSMAAQVGREIPELQSAKGIVKGVVDLFFCHEGKYYLLDWKSNLLPDYTFQTLQGEMKERHYFLQEQIYRAAVQRYIGLVDNRLFGGSFYLFLRGLKTGAGVYFHG